MYLLTKTYVSHNGSTKMVVVGYTNTAAEAYKYADMQNHINTKKYFYKSSIRYTFISLTSRFHQIVYEWQPLTKITI